MQPKRDEKMDDFFSNMHKEAYGFKPNATVFAKWTALTEEGKQSWQDEMQAKINDDYTRKTAQQEQNLVVFRDRLKSEIAHGAIDWKAAIDLMMDELGELNIEHFLWEQGLDFTKVDEIVRLYCADKTRIPLSKAIADAIAENDCPDTTEADIRCFESWNYKRAA